MGEREQKLEEELFVEELTSVTRLRVGPRLLGPRELDQELERMLERAPGKARLSACLLIELRDFAARSPDADEVDDAFYRLTELLGPLDRVSRLERQVFGCLLGGQRSDVMLRELESTLRSALGQASHCWSVRLGMVAVGERGQPRVLACPPREQRRKDGLTRAIADIPRAVELALFVSDVIERELSSLSAASGFPPAPAPSAPGLSDWDRHHGGPFSAEGTSLPSLPSVAPLRDADVYPSLLSPALVGEGLRAAAPVTSPPLGPTSGVVPRSPSSIPAASRPSSPSVPRLPPPGRLPEAFSTGCLQPPDLLGAAAFWAACRRQLELDPSAYDSPVGPTGGGEQVTLSRPRSID